MGESEKIVFVQHEIPALLYEREFSFEGILLQEGFDERTGSFGIFRGNSQKGFCRKVLLQIGTSPIEGKTPAQIAIRQFFAPVMRSVVIFQYKVIFGGEDSLSLAGNRAVSPAEEFQAVSQTIFEVFHQPEP